MGYSAKDDDSQETSTPNCPTGIRHAGVEAVKRDPVVYRLEPDELENCDLDELFDAVAAWQEGAELPVPNVAAPNPETPHLAASGPDSSRLGAVAAPSHDDVADDRSPGDTSAGMQHHDEIAMELPAVAPRASAPESAHTEREFWSSLAARAQPGASQSEMERLKVRIRSVTEDFERYKRRTEKRRDEVALRSNETLLRALLPALDDLDRAANSPAADAESIMTGVKLIQQRLRSILGSFGLRGFDSMGQPFDPSLHEALRLFASDDVAPGHVAAEVERGYWLYDVLLRPARVCVASHPDKEGAASAASTEADAATDSPPGSEPASTPPPIPPDARAPEPDEE